MILQTLDQYRDRGLLILRIGIGAMFMCHGLPKLIGGPEVWTKLGGALSAIGVNFAPTFMKTIAIGLCLTVFPCIQREVHANGNEASAGWKQAGEKIEAADLCRNCGQIKGADACCKADAAKCDKCGLAKGSPGCCKLPKAK